MFRGINPHNLETKEHYKMYKAGKQWIVAGLFVATLGLSGLELPAKADDVKAANKPTQATVTAQTKAPASQAQSQVISAAQPASSAAKQPVSAAKTAASAAVSANSQAQSTVKASPNSLSAQSNQPAQVSQVKPVSATNSRTSQATKPQEQKSANSDTTSQAVSASPVKAAQTVKTGSVTVAQKVPVKKAAAVKKPMNIDFLADTSAAPSNSSTQTTNVAQTKTYNLDKTSHDISVSTNAIYDSNGNATSPYSVAVYAPYSATTSATPTFGDQNSMDTRDNVQLGRMIVKITNLQTTGFNVDVPIYGDNTGKVDLSNEVGKYLRFKFSQAKQLVGTPASVNDHEIQFTGRIVDQNGNDLGPSDPTKMSPVPVLPTTPDPDIGLKDTDLKTLLDSNIFTDSVAKQIFSGLGLANLPTAMLNDLATAQANEQTYQKPTMDANGNITYAPSEVSTQATTVQVPVDPDSLPGTGGSMPLPSYVPVHKDVTDPKTGVTTRTLLGYAKQDEYEKSGGLNYTLVDNPSVFANVIGQVTNGTMTPSTVKHVSVQVTFGTTDNTTTLPAAQTTQANTGSHFDYTNVIVPDMPTGYELATASKQGPAITVGADTTKNTYKVMLAPISEPVSVTFTANNGNKGITKANTMGTNGTYTTNADYNSTFGKDQLGSVSVPDGYSLDSVTPATKVGLSGTNNYTATIAPKDETVTLTYSNTDGKATTMAVGTPTTATAKMDSQFGFGNITAMPTEAGYTVESKDKQNPDITVGTTGNSYVIKLAPSQATNTGTSTTTNSSTQDGMTTQTKSFDLDSKTGQISVDTNAVYDSSNTAIKPYTSAVYAPYDANQPATPTFGDQNAVDQRDSAKLGRMLVRITDRQTLGFYVDVPIYGDENTGMNLSKYVGKYLRFKFTQAKQFSGTVVNPSDPTDLYTATLVDDTGKELGPVPESEVSPIVTTPDTKLTDAQLKTSLDSNIFKDSPIANIFKSFGLDKLSDVSLNNLNTAEPSEDSYQKPIVQPDGKIIYQAPKVGIDHFTNEIPIDPQSLPGSNDQSTPLTTYVPVHSFVNDPTTGVPKEVLIGYAKKDEYQNSGGLNYTLYNAPNDGATPVGTAVNGTIKPTNISTENVQVTFGATDGATTLPVAQTPSVNTGSHFDYTNVSVPDMPTGYELAKATQQSPVITVGTDATKNTYKVMIAPISEPVSVTFTANNGNKGITKVEAMGTSGTYTTNADYNSSFGKDQLSSVSVPDGYSLDSVTPATKVGLSGTNNYTATIAPKDETVALTYENTDGKATTMASGTPTTATAKMDSQFGFGNIATMPTETGYTVESKDKQNPDITVGTTGNSYVVKLAPDTNQVANTGTSVEKVVPLNQQTVQTKAFSVDPKTGQVAVDTNAIYDENDDAIKPFSSAIYAPYDATKTTAVTFGDQNAMDTRDGVKAGRMLVKITNNQTSGFDVDIPIYGDENTGVDLSKYVGKYLRFKFSQAKQFIGIPIDPSNPTDVFTATLVDQSGKEIGPVPETEISPITTTPDIKLTDAQVASSLNSNIFTDSPIADVFKRFGMNNLSPVSLNNLAPAQPSVDSYRKPVMQPNGQIVYQAPKEPSDFYAVTVPVDPKSLPGTNDNSTSLTPYVPVHDFVTDPTTGKITETLVGYAKEDEYQNSGGLNYKLYDAPHDGGTLLGTTVNGTYTPSDQTRVSVQVTFGATDGATTLPAAQRVPANTGSHFDYTNVIVPDMPTGYELAKAAKQSPFVTVGADATKNAYKVMIVPISEPVSVTFTANNGAKGITKANAMSTNGTYTTNADYNSNFGKDQLSGVSVPDGYVLDSVAPATKVGLSGTNNYTATIAPKDETVTLTYENTDDKATTMAADAPTTASAKMDSTFGATNLATKPTEAGYSVATTQNPDITVGTTGNSYTLQYSPDSEPINVSFVADNKNATIAKLKVTGAVKANYNSTFGIKDVKALPGLPTFAGYDYAVKQNDDITVGTANNNYVVQLVAQDENGTMQVVRSDDPTKTVQQSIPFTAKMDSTFSYDNVPVAKINAIPGYTLATADKQATGKTIGTDATKNIYQVIVAPDAESVTLNLVKTNDSGKVFKSAIASANMNSSYGITQAKADLTKLKVDVPTGYSLVADNKQAADETIKTADNAYNVLIAPDAKTVTVSVAATNNVALNIPAFSQTSTVDATFGYGDVDQTKFTVPAGYQLVAKDKQAKAITVNNDETKDTYQVLLTPKTDTKVTVKTALTQSGKQPETLPADQETTATTDTKYTLADAQSLLGNKLTVNGYHVATAAEKADPDVTVAGNGSSTFTVYLAPDSETLDLKFSALDNSNAADTLNAAKVNVAVPFNSTYVFTGHEKGLPALPTGYVYKSYPSADIESTKSNTMTVEIQKAKQPVTIKVVSTNPEDKLPLQGTHEVTAKVDSKVTPSTTGVIDQTLSPHYHLAPSAKQVNQPQTVKPTNDNVYEVVLTPDSFSKTVKLLAKVRDYLNHWSTIELSSMVLSGLYGQEVSETTPTVDGYKGETLKVTLNDNLPDSLMAYVGQEAHLAVHHYLIDANHHIVRELETDGDLYGTVGGDYYIPNDLISGYHLVSITGDPMYTAADEATKDNAVNLYYMKDVEKPVQNTTTLIEHVAAPVTTTVTASAPATTTTAKPAVVKTDAVPANTVATPQPTVQVASNEPNYVVTGTLNGKTVAYVAKPVVHSVSANVKARPASHVETTETPKLSETTQQTTTKQSTPSIVLTSVQKVAKSSNKRVNLTEPQKPVKSDNLRPVKAEVPTAMKHAQVLPQTNENQTGIFGMVGAGLMSLLAVFGISKKRRD